MSQSIRAFATLSLSTLVGVGLLAFRVTIPSRASAEEFHPIKEAEMPKGFPDYTPVGQIEVKHYPAYRRATASGMAEFWTLFKHIKQNHVAMTAPVEMDYGDLLAQKPAERSMSFLVWGSRPRNRWQARCRIGERRAGNGGCEHRMPWQSNFRVSSRSPGEACGLLGRSQGSIHCCGPGAGDGLQQPVRAT